MPNSITQQVYDCAECAGSTFVMASEHLERLALGEAHGVCDRHVRLFEKTTEAMRR